MKRAATVCIVILAASVVIVCAWVGSMIVELLAIWSTAPIASPFQVG
jgi:hypothetical protein